MARLPIDLEDDVPCALCDDGPLTDPTVVVRSRRKVLRDIAALGGAAMGAPLLLPGIAVAATPTRRRTLVCVFLRGGLDGLATVVPLDDGDLAAARPDLLVEEALPLAGPVGLHPAAAPLAELFDDGRLGVLRAVGLADPVRSHFSAQHQVETAGGGATSGWLARLVAARTPEPGALAAVAIGPRVTPSLSGGPAVALADVADPSLGLPAGVTDPSDLLRMLTTSQPTVAAPGAVAALDAVAALQEAGVAGVPRGDGYPSSGLGEGLSQVARMLRADVPVEVACVDAGGFDLHAGLADRQPVLLDDLARSLAAFAADLGPRLDDVLVLAVSEFGRRVHQNGTGGTDHGRGGVALVLGGGVVGGIHGAWPGLAAAALDRPRDDAPEGDVAVTTDVRDLLGDVVQATAVPEDPAVAQVLGVVLPAHEYRPTGVVDVAPLEPAEVGADV